MTVATTAAAGFRTETTGTTRWIVADNRDRLNAYTTAMWVELPGLIRAAEQDARIRVIVLTGAGERAFSAGADITEFDKIDPHEQARRNDNNDYSAFGVLAACSKPTIAMIHGICYGGGCELAVCCDFRIAATTAAFCIPPARLGIGYNARWIRPLLQVVSGAVAKDMLFTGRRYDAQAALRIGLVGEVVAPADLRGAAEALAATLAENAPLSILAAKRAIEALSHPDGAVDMAALDALVHACFASQDYAEGRRAFKEKRRPRFEGR